MSPPAALGQNPALPSARSRHGLVDAMLFQFCVKRLRKARLRKPNNFCAFQSEIFFQILSLIMLDDGVMSEFGKDFCPAAFRDVSCDEDKVQFAFAAEQSVASSQQVARAEDKREQAFYRF